MEQWKFKSFQTVGDIVNFCEAQDLIVDHTPQNYHILGEIDSSLILCVLRDPFGLYASHKRVDWGFGFLSFNIHLLIFVFKIVVHYPRLKFIHFDSPGISEIISKIIVSEGLKVRSAYGVYVDDNRVKSQFERLNDPIDLKYLRERGKDLNILEKILLTISPAVICYRLFSIIVKKHKT